AIVPVLSHIPPPAILSRLALAPCSVLHPADILDLHSFPTRRSSDLGGASFVDPEIVATFEACPPHTRFDQRPSPSSRSTFPATRSEEHTSELQSRENLVCRLLLEKKNNKKN